MLIEVSKINKREATVVSSLDVAETFGKIKNNRCTILLVTDLLFW